jgi:thioredoxin reductase (NADPH)
LLIVGGGPAGLAAGLYAARLRLDTVLFERGAVGGQLLNTELVEDYPGIPSILGPTLALEFVNHARHFGLQVREFEEVESVISYPEGHHLQTTAGAYFAPALILAAGGLPRRLGVPGEVEFAGHGVSYCAVCDGAFFAGADLVVVGGGDAALEEADFLTRYASHVSILHRGHEFRAQSILVERAQANPKISFHFDTSLLSIEGSGVVRSVRYLQAGRPHSLAVAGVFIFIGFLPNSHLAPHADHDATGYLLTTPHMQTSIPGLWAIGDLRAQLTRQIATAVGDGTTAAVDVAGYLSRLSASQASVGAKLTT